MSHNGILDFNIFVTCGEVLKNWWRKSWKISLSAKRIWKASSFFVNFYVVVVVLVGIGSIVKDLKKELNVRGYSVHFFHLSVLDIKKVAIKAWSGCNFSNFFFVLRCILWKGLKVCVEMKSVHKYKRRYTQFYSSFCVQILPYQIGVNQNLSTNPVIIIHYRRNFIK